MPNAAVYGIYSMSKNKTKQNFIQHVFIKEFLQSVGEKIK